MNPARTIYALRVVDGPSKGMAFYQTTSRHDLEIALRHGTDAERYELVEYDGEKWVPAK